jgi:phytoene dehydrogenase-like protein
VIEHGTAVGVVLDSGETIRARRAVLADVNAPALFGGLVGHERLPARFVADLGNFQWDTPTLKLDWALSTPIPWTAAAARRAGTVQLGVDMNGLTSYSASLARREIPDHPFIVLGQMTTADPSRSPRGTESAWSYTHLPLAADLSAAVIDRHVERVERIVERHAPGFIDSIVARFIQSPAALEHENPNLRHGAINGGTAQLHQQLIFRPTIGLGGAATPIDRLFLAGSSAHPGGGVHGGPGSNAARAALARSGARGWVTRKASEKLMQGLYR